MTESFYLTVCTLGQNEILRECVRALTDIKNKSNRNVQILIVINGEERDTDFSDSIKLIFEPVKGYASVRNRAIKSLPTLANLVFLDDDEIPNLQWFDSIVQMHENYPDDVIVGPVVPSERSEIKSYREIRAERSSKIPDGALVKHGGAGNMLIPRKLIESGVVFDTHFNLSGSEDTDFCVRLSKAGVRVRFASSAVLQERESHIRSQMSYLNARFIRDTANYSVVIRRNENLIGILKRMLTLSVRIPVYFVLSSFNKSARTKLKAYSLSLLCLLTGKVRVLNS